MQRGGISPKIPGSGAFLKVSRARASPPSREGHPLLGHPAQTQPRKHREGWKGNSKPQVPWPGWQQRVDPRAEQEIYGAVTAAPPAAQLGLAVPSALLRHPEAGSGIYSSRNTWIFKYRAPKGVSLLLCCQQQRDLCSSSTSSSQGRRGALHPAV